MPQHAFAVKVTEILREPAPATTPATRLLQTMMFLRDYLELKSVPDSPKEINQLWNNEEHEITKALSLIFYKILCSEEQISSDTTFSNAGLKSPSIFLIDFVARFLIYAPIREHSRVRGPISHGAIIMLMMYLDDMESKHINKLFIDRFNVHRLFAVSFVVSYKFYEDFFYDNEYFAKLTGVPSPELNRMEMEFFKKIDWHLLYSTEFISNYEVMFESILRKAPNIEWDYTR